MVVTNALAALDQKSPASRSLDVGAQALRNRKAIPGFPIHASFREPPEGAQGLPVPKLEPFDQQSSHCAVSPRPPLIALAMPRFCSQAANGDQQCLRLG